MSDDFEDGGQPATRRRTPVDIAAEQSTLGAMMLSREARDEISDILDAGHFYKPQHETIFRAILKASRDGNPAEDAVIVSDVLYEAGDLDQVGGSAYLHTLISNVPTAANGSFYARIVRKLATRRAIITAGTKVVQIGYEAHEGDVDTDDMVGAAQKEILAVESAATDDIVSSAAILEGAFDAIELAGKGGGVRGVPSGFADLDALTGGFQAGQLIVFAARPSIGKSTVMMDCARTASIKYGLASVVFSLEMSQAEIAMRLLAAEARVELQRIRKGDLRDEDWNRLAQVSGPIADAPLLMDDSPNITVARIAAKIRQLKRSHDLKIAFIDYLQLLSSGKRVESRQLEVSEFSRALKLLAKEVQIPVIALSQLNRGPEQRQDKKPQISDLRESGSIENDADMVILLHREDFYEKESPRAGEVDLIVAKHRNGETATITLANQLHFARFADMTKAPEPARAESPRHTEGWSPSDVLSRDTAA